MVNAEKQKQCRGNKKKSQTFFLVLYLSTTFDLLLRLTDNCLKTLHMYL